MVISEVGYCYLCVFNSHAMMANKNTVGKTKPEGVYVIQFTVCIHIYLENSLCPLHVQVLVCVLSNGLNHDWPRVVSDDIHRHLEKLRNRVVTLRGRAEGRTLLPLPLCVERSGPVDIVLRSVCTHVSPVNV